MAQEEEKIVSMMWDSIYLMYACCSARVRNRLVKVQIKVF